MSGVDPLTPEILLACQKLGQAMRRAMEVLPSEDFEPTLVKAGEYALEQMGPATPNPADAVERMGLMSLFLHGVCDEAER